MMKLDFSKAHTYGYLFFAILIIQVVMDMLRYQGVLPSMVMSIYDTISPLFPTAMLIIVVVGMYMIMRKKC